jgi:hypothetical protein
MSQTHARLTPYSQNKGILYKYFGCVFRHGIEAEGFLYIAIVYSSMSESPVDDPEYFSEAVRDHTNVVVRVIGLLSTLGLFVLAGGVLSSPFVSESTTTVFRNLLWVFVLGLTIEAIQNSVLFVRYQTSVSEAGMWIVKNKWVYLISTLFMISFTIIVWSLTPYSVVWTLFVTMSYVTSICGWLAHYAIQSSNYTRKDLSAEEIHNMSDQELDTVFADPDK